MRRRRRKRECRGYGQAMDAAVPVSPPGWHRGGCSEKGRTRRARLPPRTPHMRARSRHTPREHSNLFPRFFFPPLFHPPHHCHFPQKQNPCPHLVTHFPSLNPIAAPGPARLIPGRCQIRSVRGWESGKRDGSRLEKAAEPGASAGMRARQRRALLAASPAAIQGTDPSADVTAPAISPERRMREKFLPDRFQQRPGINLA